MHTQLWLLPWESPSFCHTSINQNASNFFLSLLTPTKGNLLHNTFTQVVANLWATDKICYFLVLECPTTVWWRSGLLPISETPTICMCFKKVFNYFKPAMSEYLQFFRLLCLGRVKGSHFVLLVNLETSLSIHFLWKSCDKATVAPPHPAEFVTDATKNNK